jgi:phage terminase large subunit
MGRAKLKALKETTLVTFFDLSSQLGVSEQWEYNAKSGTINWLNGSQIILKDLFLYPSDPNFDSLGSLEITGAFIDEVSQINYKAWQVVQSRIRYKLRGFCNVCGDVHKAKVLETKKINGDLVVTKWVCKNGHTTRGLKPKMLGTCNPSKNWVYKEFYKANLNKALRSDRKFIQALPTDNPHLPETYLESLSNLDEVSRRRLLLGDWEFDDDRATLISYDAILDYFNGQHVQPEGNHYLTIDVARKGRDKTVFRVWHGWVCIRRLTMDTSTVDEVVTKAQQLQKEYQIPRSRTIADEDGVGGGVVDYLRCYGFVNNSRAKFKENYDNLKSQCSVEMAKKIEAREVVEICPEKAVIDRVAEEMEQVKYKDIDKDGKIGIVPKDKVKEKIGRSPDDWDSIMMRYYFVLMGDFVVY